MGPSDMQHWDKDVMTLTFLTCDTGGLTTTLKIHVSLLNFSGRYWFKKGGDILMCSLRINGFILNNG